MRNRNAEALGRIIFSIAIYEMTTGMRFPENYREYVESYKRMIIERDKERGLQ